MTGARNIMKKRHQDLVTGVEDRTWRGTEEEGDMLSLFTYESQPCKVSLYFNPGKGPLPPGVSGRWRVG